MLINLSLTHEAKDKNNKTKQKRKRKVDLAQIL
jgi:hypothetical protein